jgi:hypothetical protein
MILSLFVWTTKKEGFCRKVKARIFSWSLWLQGIAQVFPMLQWKLSGLSY